MEQHTHKKWIIGAIIGVVLLFASYVTYEVVSFKKDMRELGQGLGELTVGLAKLGEGLSRLSPSSDTIKAQSDSVNVADRVTDTLSTLQKNAR